MNPIRRVLPETDFAEHYRRHMRRVGYRPKPSSEWDAKAPALNRREGGESRYIRALLAAIDWPQSGTLLDVGCGTGALALAAAGRCRHVYCLDYSPVMLQTLEQNARAAGIANYSTFLLDKNADWPQVPHCDTVVCSRAGLDHDLAALFAKLSKHAAKQVYFSQIVGGRFDLPEISALLGRDREAFPDYILSANILYEMGYDPEIRFIRSEGCWAHCESWQDFQAAATAQYGSLNDGETAALHDWYQNNHHRLTPDYCGMKWALLSWQTA